MHPFGHLYRTTVVLPGYCDPLYYSVTITILEGLEVIIDPTDPVICTGESVELEAIATSIWRHDSFAGYIRQQILTDWRHPGGESNGIITDRCKRHFALDSSTAMFESVCHRTLTIPLDADLDISSSDRMAQPLTASLR